MTIVYLCVTSPHADVMKLERVRGGQIGAAPYSPQRLKIPTLSRRIPEMKNLVAVVLIRIVTVPGRGHGRLIVSEGAPLSGA
jgi:hypothetical protein